jgi:alanine racemase
MISSDQIPKILTQANILGKSENQKIENVAIDTRRIVNANDTLFVCITGKRHDAHDFIESLYNIGVRYFVITHANIDLAQYDGATFYQVKDAVEALQKLAAYHRSQITAKVVGITGSNGKTIVKEWLSRIMSPYFSVYKSPASYNSQIGVALSLLGIKPDHEWALIEAGISEPGEMGLLEKMIKPDYGILTNIGDAHDAGFESRAQKATEKKLLFKNVKWWMTSYQNKVEDEKCIFWSTDANDTPAIQVEWKDDVIVLDDISISTPFRDSASLQNLTHCLAFLYQFDADLLSGVQPTIDNLRKVSMRTEVRKGIRGCTVLSDYYNSDLESLSNVLELSSQMDDNQNKVLVLSQLEEVRFDQGTFDHIFRLIEQAEINRVYLVGPAWSGMLSTASKNFVQFDSTNDLLESGTISAFRDQLIILKGARVFEFERIERRIVRPVYGTRLEIDQEALHHNWMVLSESIPSHVKKMVMVKASAYGSGSEEISRFYQEHKVDYLGVAYANEGVELRERGVTIPILVMNAEPWSWEVLREYDLEPEIHGLGQLRDFIELIDAGQSFKIHIKCESGMNRLGFDEYELDDCFEILEQSGRTVEVISVFTHLSAADDPESDEFTRHQLQRFDKMYDKISGRLGYSPIKHALNSAGTLRFPDSQYDMVRLGIALYGYGVPKAQLQKFTPVHHLKSYIVQIKERPTGASIGYGGKEKTKRLSQIATIPVGYADGISRQLGNGVLKVAVNGHLVPTIGRICMDMCMIDVTDFKDIAEGDEVEIFGKDIPLEKFAALSGTIPYEILVRIGPRVERVFTRA